MNATRSEAPISAPQRTT